MKTLIRNGQRLHVRSGTLETWRTFNAQGPPVTLPDGFGFLLAFDELLLATGDSTEPHSDDESEMVTYVHRGALSQDDSTGNSRVIHSGEFQRMSTGHLIRHKETSVSHSGRVHLFRISLRSSEVGLNRAQEQQHFTAAQRRNLMCVVASPDGRKGSLRVHQDAIVHSTILEPGHHFVHEIGPGRSVWIHIVDGEAVLDDLTLIQGDGIGVAGEISVSLTVMENTEILLIDMGPAVSNLWDKVSVLERSA